MGKNLEGPFDWIEGYGGITGWPPGGVNAH